MSRQDTPPEKRRTFCAWMDELAALDSAGRGFIAAIFEQARKYEVRLMVATQMAMRLSDTTRQAAMQNQSVLSATGADIDEARFVAARMNSISPETVAKLGKYQYVATAELHGQRTTPFRVAGVPIDQVYADYYDPQGLPGLDAAVDRSLRRRPVRAILAHQESLDEQIADYLATHAPQPVDSVATSPSCDAGPDPLADTLFLPGPVTDDKENLTCRTLRRSGRAAD
jgi:hypothetical protein